MGNISRDVQTSGMAKVRGTNDGPAPGDVPAGYRRYVNSVAKFHGIVIHPKKGDAKDAALCAAAKEATGGLPIEFVDWVFVTDHPALIAFLDARIANGDLPGVAEDASAELARLASDAGIEMDGGRVVRKRKTDAE